MREQHENLLASAASTFSSSGVARGTTSTCFHSGIACFLPAPHPSWLASQVEEDGEEGLDEAVESEEGEGEMEEEGGEGAGEGEDDEEEEEEEEEEESSSDDDSSDDDLPPALVGSLFLMLLLCMLLWAPVPLIEPAERRKLF